MVSIASGTQAPGRIGSFYTWMAVACVATAFLGYVPTYWQPLAAGKFAAHPIVHIHGAMMFSWTLFALVQTSLVSVGRVALHRSVGLIGISLATVLTLLGPLAALNSFETAMAVNAAKEGEAFLIVPLSIIATFAVLFILAVANIGRPQVHKRLMLLATISLLNAPVARPLLTWVLNVPMPGGQPPVWINVPACWLSYLLIIAPWFTIGARGAVRTRSIWSPCRC